MLKKADNRILSSHFVGQFAGHSRGPSWQPCHHKAAGHAD